MEHLNPEAKLAEEYVKKGQADSTIPLCAVMPGELIDLIKQAYEAAYRLGFCKGEASATKIVSKDA